MPATDSLTTRMPNGITNAAPYQTMAAAGMPDPSWAHVYHNDFDTYAAGDWTVTVVGTGTAALSASDGGMLLLTTTGAAPDSVLMQLKVAGFKCVPGKEVFFKAVLNGFSDVITDTIHAGLIATGTTPLAAADAVYLLKGNGASAWTLNAVIGGVTVSAAFPAALNMVAGVPMEVGFHIDYLGNIEGFINPTTGADWQQLDPLSDSASAMKVRGRSAYIPASSLPNGITQVLLNPSFGITNGNATVHTLGVDYITAVRNR